MNLNMKSIIIHSPYDLRVENYPIEEMDENQIEIEGKLKRNRIELDMKTARSKEHLSGIGVNSK